MQFIECKNWSRNVPPRKNVKWVVLHCMEGAEKGDKAESCALWMAGKNPQFPPPKASAHYFCDSNSIVQGVHEDRIAWHAPGANQFGIGIEHAGRARQTREEWLDEFGTAMLKLSAGLCAGICVRWGISVRFVDAEGLKRGVRGITTHAEVTKAFPGGTHHDPGAGFPIDQYLAWVTEDLNSSGTGPQPRW